MVDQHQKQFDDFVHDDFEESDKMITGNFHDFKKEPVVIGILDSFAEGKYGNHPIIRVAKDKIVAVGDYTALDGKFNVEDIGKKIKIVYKGEVKGKTGRLYMDFEVYKKDIKQ